MRHRAGSTSSWARETRAPEASSANRFARPARAPIASRAGASGAGATSSSVPATSAAKSRFFELIALPSSPKLHRCNRLLHASCEALPSQSLSVARPGRANVDEDLLVHTVQVRQAAVAHRLARHGIVELVYRHQARCDVIDFGRVPKRRSDHRQAEDLSQERQELLLHGLVLVDLGGDDPDEVECWR